MSGWVDGWMGGWVEGEGVEGIGFRVSRIRLLPDT